VFFSLLIATNRNRASDLLVSNGLDRATFGKCIQTQYFNLLVRPVNEKQLLRSILDVYLDQDETHVLRHFVGKIHLELISELLRLVSQNKFSNVLVTHICRPVDLHTQVLDVR